MPLLRNDDRLSRPARGRFFPKSLPWLLNAIGGLRHSAYYPRVDLRLVNPAADAAFGRPVATLHPGETLVVYSQGTDMAPARADALIDRALGEFGALDGLPLPPPSRHDQVSYRVYLVENDRLVLTKRVRSFTPTKYRGGSKFSNACNPRRIVTAEKPLRDVATA